eukprot:CAMPEP_0119549558 /NCGR_PEP_ID=MMETSP1352-20130426/3220_1 /TAXON_ID=265584 /ORGANISM="Stauroneis constricta, Strain CCMP1120" /LENGTH=444 /DNA_ID=CAMNT_0007595143 /DNA_START=47 /DNA_END=1378 /DNA_ORIENTATION=-
MVTNLFDFSWWLGAIDLLYHVYIVIAGDLRKKYFVDGWGDYRIALEQKDLFFQRLADHAAGGGDLGGGNGIGKEAGASCAQPPPLIFNDMKEKIEWDDGEKEGVASGKGSTAVSVRTGHFASPLAKYLPEESKKCRFHYVQPGRNAVESDTKNNVVVIMLPATGEVGKGARLGMAKKLAIEHGWSSAIITAPLYGARKPKDQSMFFVRNVNYFLLQSIAIIEEATALACYFHSQDPANSRICFTGFSWGGAMTSCASTAAMLGGIPGEQIACVPYVGSATPAVFSDGMLKSSIDWDVMNADEENRALSRNELQTKTNKIFYEFHLKHVLKILADKREALLATSCDREYIDRNLTLGSLRIVAMKHDHIILKKYADEMIDDLTTHATSVRSVCFPAQWLAGGHVMGALIKRHYQVPAIVDGVNSIAADERMRYRRSSNMSGIRYS